MWVWGVVGMGLAEENKVLRESLVQCDFFHRNTIWPGLGWNPGVLGDRPPTT